MRISAEAAETTLIIPGPRDPLSVEREAKGRSFQVKKLRVRMCKT
jgi:hypothetical protein